MSELSNRVNQAVLIEIFDKTSSLICNLDVGPVALAAMRDADNRLVIELEYWMRVIGDRRGPDRDRRFSDTARDVIALISTISPEPDAGL